ncbi:MAG: hypothetical protein ACLVJB_02820 [Christensenellales bacterium]
MTDGSFDLSEYPFAHLADRAAQRTGCGGRVPFQYARQFFRLKPVLLRQIAAAQQHVFHARRRCVPKRDFEVKLIIPFKEAPVNDTAQLVLMPLPVVHALLHRNFFKLSGNAQLRRRAVLCFQRTSDNFPIVFIQRPCFNLPRAFARARVRHIEHIAHRARPVQQRDTLCAAPDVPPHRLIPDFITGTGGRFRALGVDQQLFRVTVLVQPRCRLQKASPFFNAAGYCLCRFFRQLRRCCSIHGVLPVYFV